MKQTKNSLIEGIGKTLAEFKAMHHGKTIRVVRVGGTSYMGTCDYRTDRINVELSAEGLTSKTVTVKLSNGIRRV